MVKARPEKPRIKRRTAASELWPTCSTTSTTSSSNQRRKEPSSSAESPETEREWTEVSQYISVYIVLTKYITGHSASINVEHVLDSL